MKNIKYVALGLIIGFATVVSAQQAQQLRSYDFIATIESGTGGYMRVHKVVDGDVNCYVLTQQVGQFNASNGISCVK